MAHLTFPTTTRYTTPITERGRVPIQSVYLLHWCMSNLAWRCASFRLSDPCWSAARCATRGSLVGCCRQT